MDATLNIVIRVAAKQAQAQLAATAAATGGVAAAADKASISSVRAWGRMMTAANGYNKAIWNAAKANLNFSQAINSSTLIKHGKNINWVGRQLTYNFTLPLALAGAGIVKFQKDVEESMVQVRKVYGDLTFDSQRIKEETDALGKSFELLSTRFGVHQKEVIDVGSAWASAGSSGRGLAENTKATLEAMILGEMDAAEATEALIAIQATWKLSTYEASGEISELTDALATMNIVENETGIRMQGLIEVFERSGGAARSAGVTIQELAAFAAALVPATGQAEKAGNALKTIFSRLQAPTRQTTDLLAEMGFIVDDPEWLGLSVTGKLQALADQWDDLSTAQRTFASSTFASRWQVNRFDVLMADMASGSLGYYEKALKAANDETLRREIYQRELNTVLDSSPRKWDIMVNSIRNGIANAFQPLLPAIISVITFIAKLVKWFTDLDPGIQRMVLLGLVTLAVIGPFLSLIGTTMQLVGVIKTMAMFVVGLGQALLAMGGIALWVGKFALFILINALGGVQKMLLLMVPVGRTVLLRLGMMLAPIGAAIAAIPTGVILAVVAAIVAVSAIIVAVLKTDIEDPVIRTFSRIMNWIAKFPTFLVQVFRRVIEVVARSMMIVIEWLSYLNPFARHSPSLVDNVKAGVAVILDEYGKLSRVPKIVAQALASFGNFEVTSSPDTTAFRQAELDAKVAQVSSINPSAGSAAAAMVDDIMALERVLPGLSAEISRQEVVVARLTFAYDQAEAAVESWEGKLEGIRDEMRQVTSEIDAAEDIINNLSSMSITGMIEMEDQIFANSQAQKELNLELLRMEQAGMGLDDIQAKMAAINGEIELLRGDRNALRLAGAGSDILDTYDDQIAALQDEKSELRGVADEVQGIQDALDDLDLEGRILALTRDITFDPLVREIDKLVNGVDEMDFSDITAGITEQQAVVKDLTAVYADLEKAEKSAENNLSGATETRDRILAQLTQEEHRLDRLNDAYSSIVQLIGDMEASMDAYVSAAEEAARIASDAAGGDQSLFAAAEGVNFDIAGGDSILGAEGGLQEIEDFNAEMQAEIDKILGELDLDIAKAWDDIKSLIGGKLGELWTLVKEKWGGIWSRTLEILKGWGTGIGNWFSSMWNSVWQWTYDNIVSPIQSVFAETGSLIESWIVQPFVSAFNAVASVLTGIWNEVIWPVIELWILQFRALAAVAGFVWGAISGAIDLAWTVIEPIWDAFYEVMSAFLIPVLTLFHTVGAIAWELFTRAVEVAWEVIKFVFESMYNGLKFWIIDPIVGAATTVSDNWGTITGAIQVAWDFIGRAMGGMGDLISGWSEDVAGIASGFWTAISPIGTALRKLYNTMIKPILMGIGTIFATVWNGAISMIAGAINFFGDAFNILANGINAVASLLGLEARVSTVDDVNLRSLRFNVNTSGSDALVNGHGGGPSGGAVSGVGGVQALAQGGVVGKMGEKTKEMRAIVGEGSNIHPEYVIPTDPRYRQRARGLYSELGHVFGEDAQGYDNMGFLGPVGDIIGKGASAAVGGLKAVGGFLKDKAVSAMWTPVKWAAEQAIKLIPVDFVKNIAGGILDSVNAWVSGADSAWNDEAARRVPAAPTGGAGSWRVIPQMLSQMGIPYKVLSTFRPGAITRNTGQPSWHGKDRAIDLSGPSGMINYSHSDMLKINHAIYDAYKPHLKEMIYGGPGAKNVFRGRDHNFSQKLLNEHINHVHAALARGGFVVPRAPGGNLFRIGEGLSDEAVQVTPLHGGSSVGGGGDGETTLNFYGDLSFPNIQDPDDAERLLANLEALAGVNR